MASARELPPSPTTCTADVVGEARHSIRVSGSATALGDSPDRLLSVSQLSAFLREGVLSVRIPEHEFSHNTLVYQTARDGVAEATDANGKYNINLFNGTPDRRFVWADLPQVSEVVQAPTVVGALTSLLGPGYSMHPHRALHNNNGNVDQFFHKDGHHVGERDHRPRWIMGLWFPHSVSVAMGPTCVIPGSHYLSIDKERWFDLLPKAMREDAGSLLASGSAVARDQLLETAANTFGSVQRKLTVAGGSIVFMHFDLLHRGSRQALGDVEVEDNGRLPFAIDPNIPWRPMFKLQFFRVCEPEKLHVVADDGVAPVTAEHMSGLALPPAAMDTVKWLAGLNSTAAPPMDESAATASGALEDKLVAAKHDLSLPGVAAEPIRIDAAYNLGLLASDTGSGDGSGAEAVQILADVFDSGTEASRRASQYGLAAAGLAAVPQLCRLITTRLQHLKRQIPLHLQACEADGATELVRSWLSQLNKLTHSLGEAAAAAPCETVVHQIQCVADEASYVVRVHTDNDVCAEARRVCTVSMTAFGCIGARAVQQDDVRLCSLLARILVTHVNSGNHDERAAQARAQGAAGAATREAAAHSLLRLAGAPHATATRGSVVDSRSSGRHTHPSFVSGFCADAVRRLDAVLANGAPTTSQRVVRNALTQLEFNDEEWRDGQAVFEEGNSRGAMQN
eukprot:COSAG02_NODE_621_length_19442_cov_39.261166_11_plen_680_part_00